MTHNQHESFTAGELADLFNISKQTLLYYDKIGLLEPAYIADNGYRYYTLSQYLDLDLILLLRNIDISVAKIQDFIQHKDLHKLFSLLNEQGTTCQHIIEEQKRRLETINQLKLYLTPFPPERLHQVYLTWRNETTVLETIIPSHALGRERILLYASRNPLSKPSPDTIALNVGWTIDTSLFFNSPSSTDIVSHSFFIPVPNNLSENQKCTTLPAGNYIECTFEGTFYDNVQQLRNKLLHFLSINNLSPVGNVYIVPLHNHRIVSDPTHYLTELYMRVIHK